MTDDVKALVKLEKKLISRIISMYHTTRLSDTPFADHIHGKAIVRAAFADYRAAALTAQADEIERLRAALEWYANPEVYKPSPHGLAFDNRDLSYHALAALRERDDGR